MQYGRDSFGQPKCQSRCSRKSFTSKRYGIENFFSPTCLPFCTNLFQEIQPKSAEEEINRNLLTSFVQLASKDKQLIEKAISELTSLASRDILK